MACGPYTWNNISAEDWQKGQAKAKETGIDLPGNEGNFALNTPLGAISGTYKYSPESQSLTVEVTDKPMFVPCSMIEDRLNGMMQKA